MKKALAKRLAAVAAALIMAVCLFCQPVFAGEATSVKKATASKMSIQKIEGNVVLRNQNNKRIIARANRKLYKGYTLTTDVNGTAYISLDENKVIKLGEASSLQIVKKGKKMDILLKSGSMFFDFGKLADDETLNIRTSTTVTGIRGTCGVIRVLVEEEVKLDESDVEYVRDLAIQLYHGKIQVNSIKDNKTEGTIINAGQQLHITETQNAPPVLTVDNITADTADALACQELSTPPNQGGNSLDEAKETFTALFADDEEMLSIIAEISNNYETELINMYDQLVERVEERNNSTDNKISSLFKDNGENTSSPSTPSTDSTPSLPSRPASSVASSSVPVSSVVTSSVPVSSVVTSSVVSSGVPVSSVATSSVTSSEVSSATSSAASSVPTVASQLDTATSSVNVAAINSALAVHDAVTISGTGNAVIDSDLTIPEAKKIIVSPGATLTVADGKNISCNGEIANGGTLNNLGTITITGTVTNNGTMNNSGTLINNSFNSFYQNGTLTGSGSITNNGFMQITNGLTYTGSDVAITNSPYAILTLAGGTITAKTGTGISNSGTVNFAGGRINAQTHEKLLTGSGALNKVSGTTTTPITGLVFTGSYDADGSYVMAGAFNGVAAALGGAGANQTIILASNQTFTSSETLSASGVTLVLGNKTITTDGHTITVSGANFTLTGGSVSVAPTAAAFSISNGGGMTVNGTSFAYTSASDTCLPFLTSSGNLTLQTGTLTGNYNRNVITVQLGGRFTMADGTVTDGSIVNNGTFDMTGGSMNALTLPAGASTAYIVTNAGTFTHSGGSITGASGVFNSKTYSISAGASISASVVAIRNSGTLNVNGGTVTTAESSDSLINNSGVMTLGIDLNYLGTGSAITNSANATLTLTDGKITAKSGTGISYSGTINFAGGTINASTPDKLVTGSGKTNKVSGTTTTPLTHLTFTGSYASDGTFVMSDVFGGIASALAGADASLYVIPTSNQAITSSATLSASGVTLVLGKNTVTTEGHTITVSGADFTLTGGNVYAAPTATAFSVSNGGGMTVNGTSFAYSSASDTCLPILTSSGNLTLQTGALKGNLTHSAVTVHTGGSFTMNGGTVTGGSIVNNGTFDIIGGALTSVAGSDSFINNNGVMTLGIDLNYTGNGAAINNSTGATLNLTGGTVTAKSGAGISNSGIINFADGSINAQSPDKLVTGSGTANRVSGATATPLTDLVITGSFISDKSFMMSGVFDGAAAALRSASARQSVVLTSNQTLTSSVTVSASDVSLVLANHTITTNGNTITVSGENFTLTDGSVSVGPTAPAFYVSESGKMSVSGMSFEYTSESETCQPFLFTSGSLTLQNGVLTGYINRDVISVQEGGRFTMADGKIMRGSVINGGTFNMTGGSMTVTALAVDEGGAYNVTNNGTFTHSGGSIGSGVINNNSYTVSDKASITATTIAIRNLGNLYVNGGVITTAESSEILIQNSGTMTLSVNLNYTGSGAAIDNSDAATLNLTGGTITAKSGAGIFNSGTVNFAGGKINAQTPDTLIVSSEIGTANKVSGTTTTPLTDLVFTGELATDESFVMSDVFSGVAAALRGVSANQCVALTSTQDLTSSETISVSGVTLIIGDNALYTDGKTITVSGENFVLLGGSVSADPTVTAFSVASSGDMSIYETAFSYTSESETCQPFLTSSGNLTLLSGTLTGNLNRSVVSVQNGGRFTMEEGTVTNGSVENAGTFGMEGGSMTTAAITDVVSYNVTNTGTFTHSGGTINGDTPVSNGGTCTVTGKASIIGVAASIRNSGTLYINGGTIKASAGGIENKAGTLTMTGGTVQITSATGMPLVNDRDATASITGGDIDAAVSSEESLIRNNGEMTLGINLYYVGSNSAVLNYGTLNLTAGTIRTVASGIVNQSILNLSGGSITAVAFADCILGKGQIQRTDNGTTAAVTYPVYIGNYLTDSMFTLTDVHNGVCEAIEHVAANEYIYVTMGETLSSSATVSASNVKLILGNRRITTGAHSIEVTGSNFSLEGGSVLANPSKTAFEVKTGATMNISGTVFSYDEVEESSSPTSSDSYTSETSGPSGDPSSDTYHPFLGVFGSLTLRSGTLTGDLNCTVVSVETGGSFTMAGGEIDTGSVFNRGTFNMTGGSIETAEASGDAGFIYAVTNSGTFTHSNGVISGKYCVINQLHSRYTISSDAEIEASYDGILNEGTLNVEGGTITAQEYAIINTAESILDMTGGTITASETDFSALWNCGYAVLSGGSIDALKAHAVEHTSGTLALSGTSLTSGSADAPARGVSALFISATGVSIDGSHIKTTSSKDTPICYSDGSDPIEYTLNAGTFTAGAVSYVSPGSDIKIDSPNDDGTYSVVVEFGPMI